MCNMFEYVGVLWNYNLDYNPMNTFMISYIKLYSQLGSCHPYNLQHVDCKWNEVMGKFFEWISIENLKSIEKKFAFILISTYLFIRYLFPVFH